MFGLRMGSMGAVGAGNPLNQALLAIFRKPGVEAHAYIPGIGTIGGLALQNFIMEDGTQALTVDQPWGHAGDPVSSVGAELVTNQGPFAVSSGSNTDQAGNITNNATYEVTYTASGANVANIILYANGQAAVHPVKSGTNTVYVTASTVTATATDTIRISGLATGTVTLTSIRELVGAIPALQATTANKPILRRGWVNRLLRSQEFNDAAWSTTGSVTANQTTAPDGTLTADLLAISGAAQSLYNSVGIAVQPGMVYTQSVRFKMGTMLESQYKHSYYNNTGAAFIISDVTPTITDIGGGWKLAVSSVTVPAGCTSLRVYPYRNTATINGTVFLWGAQLETGSVANTYVPTTTAAASASTGPYWAEYDGTDFLTLATVPFGLNDDFAVVFGSAINSNAANSRVFASTGATAVFRINWDNATSKYTSVFTNDAGASTAIASPAPTIALGQVAVTSVRQSGTSKQIRTNGVAGAASTAAVGVGTLSTRSDIGAQGGAVQWSGAIYPLIAIKGTITDAELSTIERWVAAQSGVVL